MFVRTCNVVNARVILIFQNSLQGWMVGDPIMKYIYRMFWNIKIFDKG